MLRLSGFTLMTVTSVVLCPILAWPRDETPKVVIQWNCRIAGSTRFEAWTSHGGARAGDCAHVHL
jgi:hypothetical protein